ncbi:hypothetical protein D3C74_171700 [compost metagenome]
MQDGPVDGTPLAIHPQHFVGNDNVVMQLRIPITGVIMPEGGVDQASVHVFGADPVLAAAGEDRIVLQVLHGVFDGLVMGFLDDFLDLAVADSPEVGDALGRGEHHVIPGHRVRAPMGLPGNELGEFFLGLRLAAVQFVEVFATGLGAEDASFISGRFAVLEPGEITQGGVNLLGQFAVELVETLVALTQLRVDLLPRHRIHLAG